MGLFKRKQPAGEKTTVTMKTQVVNATDVPGLRDEIMETLHEHGIEPGTSATIDATNIPGLQNEIMAALGEHGINVEQLAGDATVIPSGPDPVSQLEKLAHLHKTGVLTDWEFDAAKKKLLDES